MSACEIGPRSKKHNRICLFRVLEILGADFNASTLRSAAIVGELQGAKPKSTREKWTTAFIFRLRRAGGTAPWLCETQSRGPSWHCLSLRRPALAILAASSALCLFLYGATGAASSPLTSSAVFAPTPPPPICRCQSSFMNHTEGYSRTRPWVACAFYVASRRVQTKTFMQSSCHTIYPPVWWICYGVNTLFVGVGSAYEINQEAPADPKRGTRRKQEQNRHLRQQTFCQDSHSLKRAAAGT